jgi:hypothetical protein
MNNASVIDHEPWFTKQYYIVFTANQKMMGIAHPTPEKM